MPGFAASMNGRIVLSSIAISAYTLLTAFELWHGRKERLLSRWPAIAVLVLQGVVFLSPIPIVFFAAGDSSMRHFPTDGSEFLPWRRCFMPLPRHLSFSPWRRSAAKRFIVRRQPSTR
jgi:hypothetical protein